MHDGAGFFRAKCHMTMLLILGMAFEMKERKRTECSIYFFFFAGTGAMYVCYLTVCCYSMLFNLIMTDSSRYIKHGSWGGSTAAQCFCDGLFKNARSCSFDSIDFVARAW